MLDARRGDVFTILINRLAKASLGSTNIHGSEWKSDAQAGSNACKIICKSSKKVASKLKRDTRM